MKLCDQCWEQAHYNWDMLEYNECCGEIVEIDDIMVLPLQILHRKGYKTLFSCSGHVCVGEYLKAPYIMISIPLTFGRNNRVNELFSMKSFSKVKSKEADFIMDEYRNTNLKEIMTYFTSCNVHDTDDEFLTFNKEHEGLRMTIRHNAIPHIRGLGNEVDDYISWLSCNQDFLKIISNAPDVVIDNRI